MSLAKSTLKVVQKLHIGEKVYFDQLLKFSNLAFILTTYFSYCVIFKSLNAGFFLNTISVSNSLDPDQACFIGPHLGSNCLQRLSAEDKSCR